jgi:hypothetical protein
MRDPREASFPMTLAKQPAKARHPNLVFSSVGDQSNCRGWLRGRRNFDLWVTYYGDRPGSFLDIADYYEEHRGSKYQNLHHAYRQWSELLGRYAAVLVLDDDIIISGTRISRLFEIRKQHDLWALQPAFSPRGKVSWPITRVDRRNELRFTSFIEMACPLFRKDKLDAFMAVYDPELIGWGCDWWFLEAMGPDLRGRVAVVDAIPCVNPYDWTKAGREIDRLAPTNERHEIWERIKEKYQIQSESRGVHEYGVISKSLLPRTLGRLVDASERLLLWARASQSWPFRLLRVLRSRTPGA